MSQVKSNSVHLQSDSDSTQLEEVTQTCSVFWVAGLLFLFSIMRVTNHRDANPAEDHGMKFLIEIIHMILTHLFRDGFPSPMIPFNVWLK